MKIISLVTLAFALLIFSDANPIGRRPRPNNAGHSVPVFCKANYKQSGRAQPAKLSARYSQLGLDTRFPTLRNNAATSGRVPLTDVDNDLEYYGSVSVGIPAQGSSDIWFPYSTCTTAECKKHVQFNSAKSSTYHKDGRTWTISYGDGSSASGTFGSDIVNVGGTSVRQTIGLANKESSQFGSALEDGLFGLGFNTIESVSGVKTFLDNAIIAGILARPIVSAYLPSVRRNGGVGYWQILIQDAGYNGVSLKQSSQGIVDTGTTLIIIGDAAAKDIHAKIPGATNDPSNGWLVPCSVASSTANVSFRMGGASFNVPVADLAYEDIDDGSENCFSGIQGGQDGVWILGDVFIKNNYCVFSQTSTPSIGIAQLKY
ncbi:Type I transmembrane sorting receptor [Podila humilis]|nr:Type I transmembrane sorting receptor [Podila humilis]